MSLITRVRDAATRIGGAVSWYTGGGSGQWEGTGLTEGQRDRSMVLQDTRRSLDQLTWRKQLAYARQLFTNFGEFRGPMLERAMFANSGGWQPRCVGKRTDKRTRSLYEEWLWNWMKVSNLRGQPYDFWTDMLLASVALDRDGEPPYILTKNRSGDPRIQWIANHRIYSRVNNWTVTEPGEYFGRPFNNGVVYDDQATPIAYYVLDESLQWSQAIKGQFISARSMANIYKPDWCDSGRGTTAMAHAIKKCFDLDDIHFYLLLGVKRNVGMDIISESEEGPPNPGADHLSTGSNGNGDRITLQTMDGGGIRHVMAGKGTKIQLPPTKYPEQNVPEYMEDVLMGVYQGLPWPYEFTRMSKDAKGANIRVVVEKVNFAIDSQFTVLEKIAKRQSGYALGTAVHRGELPPGEWWETEFSRPPKLTADRWRQFQEDRENYKIGHDTLRDIAARNGCHWQQDLREQRDVELDDKMVRCEKLYLAHQKRCQASGIEPMSFAWFVQDYEQRSANPAAMQTMETGGDDDEKEETKPAKPAKGKTQ